MKFLYLSLVDISLSSGPSVNERGFLRDMANKYGSNFVAIVPRAQMHVPSDVTGVQIVFLNLFRDSRSLFGWLECRLTGFLRIQFLVNRFNPEVIVMRPGALALPQYLVVVLNKKRRIFLKTAGDGLFGGFYGDNWARKQLRMLNEYLFGAILNGAEKVDVVSEIQLNRLGRKFTRCAEKISVIDNGVDTNLFHDSARALTRQRYGWREGDVVLGYAGSQPFKRGGRELIDCVHHFKDMPVYGLIVGPISDKDQSMLYAQRLGILDRMIFTGGVDYLEVPELMAAFDIGVSLRCLEERGCSELKVRQYLATGAYIIGTEGSNDFLKNMPYASVLEQKRTDLVIPAVLKFLEFSLEERASLRQLAKDFALFGLSISSRNTERLKFWQCVDIPSPSHPIDPNLC
jgi:glycosyltransferase involved in cell wall biosynthesis